MHLIPPDCSRAEAVVRIAHSLQAFQQSTDQILSRAVQRAGKCRDRLDQLVSRVEVLERKLDVLDQVFGFPYFRLLYRVTDGSPPGFALCRKISRIGRHIGIAGDNF